LSQLLSAELRTYHGIMEYDNYIGSADAIKRFISEVSKMPGITVAVSLSAESHFFTNPFYPNSYTRTYDNNVNMVSRLARGLFPSNVTKAVFSRSCSSTSICQYPLFKACGQSATACNAGVAGVLFFVLLHLAAHTSSCPCSSEIETRLENTAENCSASGGTTTQQMFSVYREAFLIMKRLKQVNFKRPLLILEQIQHDALQSMS
ncbi:unnamed protein product, partial [Ixodes hexagonus]